LSTQNYKIAITADPELPVPPLLYGGIERIIHGLTNYYVSQGHEVHLFANEESKSAGILHPWRGKSSTSKTDSLRNAIQLRNAHKIHKFDVIHSFSRLAYLLFLLPLSAPKIMSYQREPTLSQVKLARSLAKKGSLIFTGCSGYISRQISAVAESTAIHNFVDTDFFSFNHTITDDAPLVFLGRVEPIKGPKEAIEIAARSNKKLIIAGNIPTEYTNYFDNEIEPLLNDDIRYMGPVNDQQKKALLENASALLMPIQWNEPFGIVMIEAMACGTPVLGFSRGAVPEVIFNGINGYRCSTIEEMIANLKEVTQLDRLKVREYCESHFSIPVISKQYLSLYRKLQKKNERSIIAV
jgi:glycosyltransferase involved in cell wall biosynthesis